jgi:excisionase family DNA binding protein
VVFSDAALIRAKLSATASREDQMTRLAITVDEFCGMIGIGRTKTYELIKDGSLETVAIGRRRLIKMSSVEALLAGGTSGCAAETPFDQPRRGNVGM